MPPASPALVLASSSPQRLALLAQIGVVPDGVIPPAVDETPHTTELPPAYAARMARDKALKVAADHPQALVLACDTTVVVGRRLIHASHQDVDIAKALNLLSGRRHRVLSAVALRRPDGAIHQRCSTTIVTFTRLEPADIAAYIASGEGRGKAGGYAIQGRAAAFVRFMRGSYSGVMGLPLFETAALLRSAGYGRI